MTTFRILHVDDEPDIREVVRLSLALDPELVIRSCCTGKEALAEAASWSPDLILCDVMMPGMDGPNVLKRLLANPLTAKIPLVFMTARAQETEAQQLKALGASGLIAKPFNARMLAKSVREQLRMAMTATGDVG